MPLVYSTNPDFNIPSEDNDTVETLPPSRQKLTVYLDRRNRGGKQVTLVKGFVGSGVKDGEILIQGDCRDKVTGFLTSLGYVAKRGN